MIPWVAMRLGRPVQWIEDRREHLMATNHSRQQYHDIEIGFDRDGRIVALADRFVVDMGAYIRTHGVVVPELTAALLPGPYRIPNYSCRRRVRADQQDANRHVSRPRSVRVHVRARAADGHRGPAARRRPVELRRRNFITPGEMPYEVGGDSLDQRIVYDCGDYRSALDQALEVVGYDAARAEQAAARRQGRYVGIGVGCVLEKAGLGPWEYARVEVDATGHVVVYSGVAAVGQGIETTLAQVCADELGVAPEAITVVHGDSARMPFGVGGFASRGASVALPAAMEAARKVRAKIVRVAAGLLEAAPARSRARWRRGPCARRAGQASELPRARARGSAGPAGHGAGTLRLPLLRGAEDDVPVRHSRGDGRGRSETGQVRLLRYAIAYDVGRAVNPMIVDGQLVGALAQGIGGALLEELVYDERASSSPPPSWTT